MSAEPTPDVLDQLVEAAGRAMFPTTWDGVHSIGGKWVRDGLLAALSTPLTEPCPTCWGRVNDVTPAATCKNPDCDGGRVPSSVRLIVGEQVGWIHRTGALIVKGDEDAAAMRRENWRPVLVSVGDITKGASE